MIIHIITIFSLNIDLIQIYTFSFNLAELFKGQEDYTPLLQPVQLLSAIRMS